MGRWNDPTSDVGKQVWAIVDQRLKSADVSYEQVQVAWVKQAIAGQGRLGEFPAHAKRLESDLITAANSFLRRPKLALSAADQKQFSAAAMD